MASSNITGILSTTPNTLTVNGTDNLSMTLIGSTGPAGPAGINGVAGPNQVTTSTLTPLTGYIYGNGTTVGGATAGTSLQTANTLVLRDNSGHSAFNAVILNDGIASGAASVSCFDGAFSLTSSLESKVNFECSPAIYGVGNDYTLLNDTAGSHTYTLPSTTGTLALLTDIPASDVSNTPNTLALRDASEGSLYGSNIYCAGTGVAENGYLKLYNPTLQDYASIYSTGSKVGMLPIQTTEGAIEFTHATRTAGPNPTNVTSVVFTNGLDETYTFPTAGGTLLANTGNLAGLTNLSTARSSLGLGTDASPTFQGLTLTSASLTTSTPNTITQTWNAAGTTFTAAKINATQGVNGSAASSLLLDLQLDGTSKVSVSKSGLITASASTSASSNPTTAPNGITFNGSNGKIYISQPATTGSGLMFWQDGGAGTIFFVSGQRIAMQNSMAIEWASTDSNFTGNLFLTRKTGASLRLGAADTTGTTAPVAQTLGVQSWASSTTFNQTGAAFTIAGSQGTGTGAGGSINFQTATPSGTASGIQNPLTTKLTIAGSGNVGIGSTVPIDKLHINSAGASNIYLGTAGNNNGTHQIKYNFGEGIFSAAIVGIATGANSSGNLELRVAGAGTGNAVQSDTGIRVTASDVQILKSLTYTQDVLAIGNNHNSGVKAFKFTRSENKAAIWSVPGGDYGRGDIRFTTGNAPDGTAKTEANATVIIARAGGLISGNSYLAQQPTDGQFLVSNNVGIGTTTLTEKLNVAGSISATENLIAKVRLQGTAPASATATGTAGDIRYDATHIYICTATDTWKRAAIATWP